MKIRAKLKDVVILPDEGNDYEKNEILRITSYVKDDPEAILKIDGKICSTKGLFEGIPLQFYLNAVSVLGRTSKNEV